VSNITRSLPCSAAGTVAVAVAVAIFGLGTSVSCHVLQNAA
jgi:hypothetical protein